MYKDSITCILVNWHCSQKLRLCLESLLSPTPTLPLRIIVVNNDSESPLSPDFLSSHPEVQIIEAGSNIGFGAACNLGASMANDPYLLFRNPDILVVPGSIEAMVSWMNTHPQAGGAGGMLLSPAGYPQYGFMARKLPTLKSVAIDFLLIGKLPWLSFHYHGYGPSQLNLDCPTIIEQPAAACLLIRRKFFQTIHGFDSDYWPAWYEDVDLCLRLKRSHISLYFLPFARFIHSGGASLDSLSWRDYAKFYHRNLLLYFRKNHLPRTVFFLRMIIFLGLILRILLIPFDYPRRAGSRKAAWLGYIEVMKVLFHPLSYPSSL
jgi:GT2 family glycosyltransferase